MVKVQRKWKAFFHPSCACSKRAQKMVLMTFGMITCASEVPQRGKYWRLQWLCTESCCASFVPRRGKQCKASKKKEATKTELLHLRCTKGHYINDVKYKVQLNLRFHSAKQEGVQKKHKVYLTCLWLVIQDAKKCFLLWTQTGCNYF